MGYENVVSIQAEMPVHLVGQVQQLVADGWYRSFDEILADALRRFLEAHRTELIEKYILEDVAWGLHGHE